MLFRSDLKPGELRPHRREDKCTKITKAKYDPSATSAVFSRFINDVFPDAEMQSFARRAIGASLGGMVRDHVLHIWYGPKSGNGKSRSEERRVGKECRYRWSP